MRVKIELNDNKVLIGKVLSYSFKGDTPMVFVKIDSTIKAFKLDEVKIIGGLAE